MKKIKLPMILAVCLLGAGAASAQSLTLAPAQGPDIYSSQETSFDIFGFHGSRNKDGKDEAWGPGVGINHFFTQNIGVGGDSYADAFELPYLLNANGIYRYPIGNTPFAAYGFAGLGRQWKHAAQWLGDIGAGIEYRLGRPTPVGLFLDIREVFPTETSDYSVFRFGLRFKFK